MTFQGEDNLEIDDDFLNLILAERPKIFIGESNIRLLVRNFIQAELNNLYQGRRFNQEEHTFLLQSLPKSDDILLASFEVFSITQCHEDLVETLQLFCRMRLKVGNSQPLKKQVKKQDSNSNSDIQQRDSWPRGFEKMIDKTRAIRSLEQMRFYLPNFRYLNIQQVD